MENKKFSSQRFDKFKQTKTTDWVNPISGSKWGVNWKEQKGYGDDIKNAELNLDMRYVESPEINAIVIDYYWLAHDWMFIRNGKLIINCDSTNNVELEPHESNTKVGVFGGTRISESGFYQISKEQLKFICDAKEIEVRVSGSSTHFELKGDGLLKFQFMCRSFYSDLFSDSTHYDWIDNTLKQANKSKGACFIATATLGDYNHPIVKDLRVFRDNWILQRTWGEAFVNWYYDYGAKVAAIIDKSSMLKSIVFIILIKPLHFVTKMIK